MSSSSTRTPVLVDEIDGARIDIFLSTVGKFYAIFNGETVEAPSKAALHDKLRRLVKTHNKIAVPATLIESHYDEPELAVTHIELTGLHGRHRTVIYTEVETKRQEQLQYGGQLYRRLTADEIAAAQALWTAYKTAEKAWEDWQADNQIDGTDVLREAQDAAMGVTRPESTDE